MPPTLSSFTSPFWPLELYMPFSGGNQQTLLPNWFNTTITYAGDPQIENRVIQDVASFGKQIGIICDALIELAGSGAVGPDMTRLRELATEVDEVKRRYRGRVVERIGEALESVERMAPEKADRMLDEIERKLVEMRATVERKRRESSV